MGDLTRSFSLIEFNTRNLPIPTGGVVHRNLTELARNLQVLRDHLGEPVTIVTGYLDLASAREAGLPDTSRHIEGKAADLVVKGTPVESVNAMIEYLIDRRLMVNGGLNNPHDDHVHYDIREQESRFRSDPEVYTRLRPLRDYMKEIHTVAMSMARKRGISAQQLATFFQEEVSS